MTTISIKEDTRKKLLRIAGEIQKKTQERADFDTVIQFLIDAYNEKLIDLEDRDRLSMSLARKMNKYIYNKLQSKW